MKYSWKADVAFPHSEQSNIDDPPDSPPTAASLCQTPDSPHVPDQDPPSPEALFPSLVQPCKGALPESAIILGLRKELQESKQTSLAWTAYCANLQAQLDNKNAN